MRGREFGGGPGGRHGFGFGFGPGPGFGPGFGRGGGGGRGERFLEQGDLRWLVLDLIDKQPRHGYEIIKAIEEMMGGQYSPSPGVVYPTLTFLEETGLIDSEAEGKKKLYNITDDGKAALAENAESIAALRGRIDQIKARFGGAPAPELSRAMGNLRSAIQIRMSKGELSPEALATITAAIDRAAGEIERS